MPRLEASYEGKLPKTFPSRPAGPFAALRHRVGRYALNRGGTVEFNFIPNGNIEDGVFFIFMYTQKPALKVKGDRVSGGMVRQPNRNAPAYSKADRPLSHFVTAPLSREPDFDITFFYIKRVTLNEGKKI